MKKILAIVLCLAVVCFSAGCGAEEKQAGDAHVINCFGSIVNAEGQLILAAQENAIYRILTDSQGRQTFVVAEIAEDCLQPSQRFAIYDLQGNLLTEMQAEGELDYFPAWNGDYQKSLIVCNLLLAEHKYQIVNFNSEILLEKEITLPEQCYWAVVGLCPADDFFAVELLFYQKDETLQSAVDFYDWQGEPLTFDDDFKGIASLYYFDGWRYLPYSGYYQLFADKISLMDAQGRIFCTGLDDVRYLGDDLFFAVQDGQSGIIDKDGVWHYPQPAGGSANADMANTGKLYYTMDDNGIRDIVTAAGDLVLAVDKSVLVTDILLDYQGQQRAILLERRLCDETQPDEYGLSRLLAMEYTFYDLAGRQVGQAVLPMPDMSGWETTFRFAPSGDLQQSFFLMNRLNINGSYAVYNCAGDLLWEKCLIQPEEYDYCSADLQLSDRYIIANYILRHKLTGDLPQADVYLLDGTPVETDQVYQEIKIMEDELDGRIIGYIGITADGEDLLDEDMRLVGHYQHIEQIAWGGVFVAEQAERRGLCNMQGEWIYQEDIVVEN